MRCERVQKCVFRTCQQNLEFIIKILHITFCEPQTAMFAVHSIYRSCGIYSSCDTTGFLIRIIFAISRKFNQLPLSKWGTAMVRGSVCAIYHIGVSWGCQITSAPLHELLWFILIAPVMRTHSLVMGWGLRLHSAFSYLTIYQIPLSVHSLRSRKTRMCKACQNKARTGIDILLTRTVFWLTLNDRIIMYIHLVYLIAITW